MGSLPKVLLADDHVIFTEGLLSLLKGKVQVVGAVRDGALLVDAASRLRPDIIVADISMPTMGGIEALRRLKDQKIDSLVIFLTMHADAALATGAFRAGASGFLLKESSCDELLAAIHEVLAGHMYITPAIGGEVIRKLMSPADPVEVRLTPRQLEIVRLVVEGRRMKEIAAMLDLAPRTAESMKYDLMHTLNVHSTAELVRYALHHGLVPNLAPLPIPRQ